MLNFSSSWTFTAFINFAIILNTICLGLDKYPSDDVLNQKLEKFNYAFFAIFLIELVIKVIGFGPKVFLRDNYNIFDTVVGK